MKKKINIILLFVLFLSVGITLAFFTSTSTLDNEFKSGKYKTVSTDSFTSPSSWSPGDTTPKTITTKNEGTLPVRVRVKLEESWESENGDTLPLLYNNEPVAIINFDNEDDWVQDGSYYYYVGELEPGDTTSSLIESVTYNPNAPSDMSCTSNNGVYNCKSTGDGYDGATYTLNIIVETVQSDAVLSAWNLSSDPTVFNVLYTSTGTVLSDGVASDISDSFDNYESVNENIFLRYTSREENIIFREVGFILNNNVYYLKGAGATYNQELQTFNPDSIYYNKNKATVISAFGVNNCNETLVDYEGGYKCEMFCSNSELSAIVGDDGHVIVELGGFSCSVSEDGASSCGIMNA